MYSARESIRGLIAKVVSKTTSALLNKFWSAEVFASAHASHASAETDALQNAIFVKTNLTV